MTSDGYSNLGVRGKNFQKLMLSEKKKRSDLGSHIFLPKSRCSLKKKGLHFNYLSDFPIFLPKSGCSLKKKGLHSESFPEQTFAADSKLYVLFSRGVSQKKGRPEATPSFASPNIHHCL